jgi:hypothetical protein
VENFKPVPDDVTKVMTPGGPHDRWVVCAANLCEDGVILCGARHWDHVMRAQADAMGWDDRRKAEQGFIDQWGNWMSREDAKIVAIASGQIEEAKFNDNIIFSEDLY